MTVENYFLEKPFNKNIVTTTALNILINIPIIKVIAKPLTILVENQIKIRQVSNVEIFPSRIDVHALENPSSISRIPVLPKRFSSFIRSKIRTFASTAIPIDNTNPASPAKVKKHC